MGRFALVFPGQGSQYPGMGEELYREYPAVRDLFAEASDVFGTDMAQLCFKGPQELLDLTVNTQTSILTVEIAAWRVFSGMVEEKPVVLAGHSLGEYSALHAAGAVDLRSCLMLVKKRAQLHQEAVPVGEGAMAAIMGLERNDVEEICRVTTSEGSGIVEVSIENSPGQIVISGHTAAIAAAVAAAGQKEGARAVILPISVPCHCSLLAGAAEKFASALAEVEFRDCSPPVIPNCDPSAFHTAGQTGGLLARQIRTPVLWRDTVLKMAAMDVDTIVELGPKRILSGLIRRIDRRFRLLNGEDRNSLEETAAALNNSL
ncbi:MAG: ACP S-malonyltransferase [Syntrophales bacterium]|jgi:[acyl-carrier-protein] S-malonyltransferase|nr:ACP S-malonyltransferase [Syntrophales bacterium]